MQDQNGDSETTITAKTGAISAMINHRCRKRPKFVTSW
jgi:hypothetical protein